MKINMHCAIKKQFVAIMLGLLGLLCASEAYAMQRGVELYGKQTPAAIVKKRNELIIKQKLSQLAPDEILICQEGTADCIPVNKEIIKSSETLNGLFESFEGLGNSSNPISIKSPIADIKNSCDIIKIYADCLAQKVPEYDIPFKIRTALAKYSVDQLIGICNCQESLLYPEKLFAFCWDTTKQQVFATSSAFHSFQRLKPHLQLLMFTPSNIINHLKKTIIKRYENDRKIRLGDGDADSTAWSPDGNKLCATTSKEIKIWNLIDETNTIFQLTNTDALASHSIAFSPDSNKIACESDYTHIEVWDINQNERVAILNSDAFVTPGLAFTPNGTGIFFSSETFGDNYLKHWNFTRSTYPSLPYVPQQFIIPFVDFGSINSIALSSDKKRLAVGYSHYGNKSLVLYAMNSLTNITLLGSINCPDLIRIIAFSSNGKKIIAYASKDATTLTDLIVFDITKPDKISPQATNIKGTALNLRYFESAAFTSDSECIVAAGPNYNQSSALALKCINDPDNTSYLNFGKGKAVSVAPSHDNSCKIAFADDRSLFTWTLWTGEEYATLDLLKLYKNTDNADQLRLLYDICFKSLNILDKAQLKVFSSLEVTLQQLLVDLFFDNLHKPTSETDSSQKSRIAQWLSRWAPSWVSQLMTPQQ